VLDGTQLPHGKGYSSPPHFLAHFTLAHSAISATAELLNYRLDALPDA